MTRSTAMWRRCAVVAAAGALVASGCAVNKQTGAQSFAGVPISDDPCARTATAVGSVLGAIAGGVVANQIDRRTSTKVLGVAAGATVGALVGRDIDRRRCELFKIAKKYDLDITVSDVAVPPGPLLPPGTASAAASSPGASGPAQGVGPGSGHAAAGLSVTVRDSGRQFDSGSDRLNPQALAYFGEMADQYAPARTTQRPGANPAKSEQEAVDPLRLRRILLVGHTDDIGDSRTNAELSERRAMAVAKVFRDHGIAEAELFYQGAGETLPAADNRTEAGRARNRRVEIIDLGDDATFQKFLGSRMQRIDYYRPAPVAMERPSAPGAPIAAPARGPASPPARAVANAAARPTTRATGTEGLFDFGGTPVSAQAPAADFGAEIADPPGLSLITSAQAAGPVLPSCSADRPRHSRGVKSLRQQQDIAMTEYMPGLYDTSWMDTVNGHLVGLSHVAVYRDGGSPANKPTLHLYKGYKPGGGAKPDFTAQPEVNAYRGDKAILYRVFVDGPVKCLDLLFPYDNSGQARDSNLFYDKNSRPYVATFRPRLAR